MCIEDARAALDQVAGAPGGPVLMLGRAAAPGFVKTPLTDQNDFEMPFLIEAPEAARIIADGLERGDAEIAFPRRMTLAMKALGRFLPGPLRRRYVARVARKRARDRAAAG